LVAFTIDSHVEHGLSALGEEVVESVDFVPGV